MKINLLFSIVLITSICSCKKSSDNVDPNVFPKDKAPIFSVDKSTFKTSYAVGDTVKTTFTITDNGYGKINQIYIKAEVNYGKTGISVGTFHIDTVNINPPVTQYQYKMKWKIPSKIDDYVNGFNHKMLVSGDSVRFGMLVIFADKPNTVNYWSSFNNDKFYTSFLVK